MLMSASENLASTSLEGKSLERGVPLMSNMYKIGRLKFRMYFSGLLPAGVDGHRRCVYRVSCEPDQRGDRPHDDLHAVCK